MHSSWDSEPISRVMTSSSGLTLTTLAGAHLCVRHTLAISGPHAAACFKGRLTPPPPPHCSSRKLCLLLRDPCRTHSLSFLNGSPIWPAPCPHERALVASHPDRRRLRPRESVRLRGRSCRLFFKAHPCHSARTPPSSVLCLLSKPSPLLQCDWFLLFFRPEVRPVNHCLITAVTITESLLCVRHGAPRYTLQGLSRPAPGSGVAPSCSAWSLSVTLSHTRVPFRGNSRLRHARPCHDSPVT